MGGPLEGWRGTRYPPIEPREVEVSPVGSTVGEEAEACRRRLKAAMTARTPTNVATNSHRMTKIVRKVVRTIGHPLLIRAADVARSVPAPIARESAVLQAREPAWGVAFSHRVRRRRHTLPEGA